MNSPGPLDGGQDFELNLASIIDCLTVIIAFLLLSSSFVSYGTLDTAVAALDEGVTVGYGMRANERPFADMMAALGALGVDRPRLFLPRRKWPKAF
mgnify:CR=1 FL=1